MFFSTNIILMIFCLRFPPVCRLDRQTQATTLVHQIFGGYLRSRGIDFVSPPPQRNVEKKASGVLHCNEFAAFGIARPD